MSAATADAAFTVSVIVGVRQHDAPSDTWQPARLDDAFIDRGRDSLTLERLSELMRFLHVDPLQWPTRNVRVEKDGVSCSPNNPAPRDAVSCSVAISNPGERAVHARVSLEVQPDQDQGGAEVVVKVPARGRKSLKFFVEWPDEEGATVNIGIERIRRSPYHRHGEQGEAVLSPRTVAEEAFRLSEDGPHGELEPILMASGTLEGPSRSFDVPVDSSVSRLLVAVNLDNGQDIKLFRPGGAVVTASDRDVTLGPAYHFDLGRATVSQRNVFSVAAPEAGLWRVELRGTAGPAPATFEVTARGTSPVQFGTFEFVTFQPSFHGGYFAEDEALPVAGAVAIGRVRARTGPPNPVFHVIDESGATLQRLELRHDDPNSGADAPVGSFRVPAVPFSIVMHATDSPGASIRRQSPVLIRPQTVSVSFRFDPSQLPEVIAGATKQFKFTVTNHGAAPAAFALNATTSLGEIQTLSPRAISLSAGESANATFDLVVPATVSQLDFIFVRLTATDRADAARFNSANFTLEVARPVDK